MLENSANSETLENQPVENIKALEIPAHLYVPIDALHVSLEQFEGPLDLLLYLIQHNNMNILDIPIAEITRQYLDYVELMKAQHLDLAAEYLVMAAVLMEIKSRLLLPAPEESPFDLDPRTQLIAQLQEYALYKKAAEELADLPRVGRDILPVIIQTPEMIKKIIPPDVSLDALLMAMREVMERASFSASHQVTREPLSIRERMQIILDAVKINQPIDFPSLFTLEEGRAGVVVTLLAILELVKESLIKIIQKQDFDSIQVTKA